MRLETVTAFTLLLKGAGKAATEQILKDLMKQLRNGLVDKALVMRIAAAQVRMDHLKIVFGYYIITRYCAISVYRLLFNMQPNHSRSMM